MYDPFTIASYNVLYTSLPVVAVALFEQDACDVLSTRFPRLYAAGAERRLFNRRQLAASALHGVATSVVVFFAPVGKASLACRVLSGALGTQHPPPPGD